MQHVRPTIGQVTVCALILCGSPAMAAQPSIAQTVPSVSGEDVLVTGRHHADPAVPSIAIKARNIIGFARAKEDGPGRLVITDRAIAFVEEKTVSTISISAVRSVAIERTSKPLLRGIPGTLAGMAPNGGGQVYSLIRPGAELLTIIYSDENSALRAALILIPKSGKVVVRDAFAKAGIALDETVGSDGSIGVASFQPRAADDRISEKQFRSSVIVTLPQTGPATMPAAFRASAYEQLVAETEKSGLFGAVWRQGDRRASSDALTMAVRITEFKKGSPSVRATLPVLGMVLGKTLITANVSLTDAAGVVILDQEVKGSKRTTGESITATKSLAQRVTGSIKKIPGFVKGPPSVSRYASTEMSTR